MIPARKGEGSGGFLFSDLLIENEDVGVEGRVPGAKLRGLLFLKNLDRLGGGDVGIEVEVETELVERNTLENARYKSFPRRLVGLRKRFLERLCVDSERLSSSLGVWQISQAVLDFRKSDRFHPLFVGKFPELLSEHVIN
ncbi:MAG: hypothetical protein KF767_17720 [Bdellovibrionaceae bacterium]|nr:hypothetical protein [Pseudobdellovibrionaceae bacterium]